MSGAPLGPGSESRQSPPATRRSLPVAKPSRVTIGAVAPEVEGGRFPAKRCLGDQVTVKAEVTVDGHDLLDGVLRYRRTNANQWNESPLNKQNAGLDTWTAHFTVDSLGEWEFVVVAWVDRFRTWLAGFGAKLKAGVDVAVEIEQGALYIEAAAAKAEPSERGSLVRAAAALRAAVGDAALAAAEEPTLVAKMRSASDRNEAEGPIRRVLVDPVLARFSAWYEFFPRSTGESGEHGTFETSRARLRYAASMGFDVVYLPPIHPIGFINRKGQNNSVMSGPDDPGSPWAIGSAEGGHRAVHPALGELEDFRNFAAAARELGLEIALDLAFQCAPDHPLVASHPEWFRKLPDGSIAHAENPPKRYEDIVPFDFECEDWEALWQELLETTLFWIEQGVRVFRVDNPHTKPLPFWEWLFTEVRTEHPDVIFLAEAFARPALIHGLARRGFNQSYTYFTWRNTRHELETYLTDLTQGPGREYLRPNLWPNTPDILPEYLQAGGRPAAVIRLVLAATLSASYGIYGPAFELCANEAIRPDSEEYRDSEKYQLRSWDIDSAWSLRDLIMRVNAIRRDQPALQQNDTLAFHPTTNDRLICYTKYSGESDELVVVVVNLDPQHKQAGTVIIDESKVAREMTGQYLASDLLGGGSYLWEGRENFVELDPFVTPAHIFSVRRKLRSERDFDYFF